MARKARIHIDGGLYHVMLRGNAGHDIFFADEDYKYFYKLVEEGVERYGHRVHARAVLQKNILSDFIHHIVVPSGFFSDIFYA